MASQGRARPLATNGAIMSTRKQEAGTGCERWPRWLKSTQLALPRTTARPSAASAPARHCAFGSYRHRHRQVAGLARAAINQTTGSGAGTIRAMSTAEMPPGEIVSPPARCASRCRCMPARRAWMSQRGRSCRERLQAPTARTCARQHFRRRGLPPALRSPCAAGAAGQASCAHLTDDDPMSWRRRAPRSAHRMPTMPPRVCAATNASAHAVGLRPRCAHGPNRSPPAIQARSGGRRLRNTVIAHRRRGRRAHRCAGPSLPSKR